MRIIADYLVIGSGVAGLTLALRLAKHGKTIVLTKRATTDSNTAWAQGGIAGVFDPEDSFAAHVEDTLRTGCGLCHPETVEMVVSEGPDQIRTLMNLGAEFSRDEASGALDLTREGGHSARRVIHAGDITGREVQRALTAAVEGEPNIEVLENHMAVDLIELSKFGARLRSRGPTR